MDRKEKGVRLNNMAQLLKKKITKRKTIDLIYLEDFLIAWYFENNRYSSIVALQKKKNPNIYAAPQGA